MAPLFEKMLVVYKIAESCEITRGYFLKYYKDDEVPV